MPLPPYPITLLVGFLLKLPAFVVGCGESNVKCMIFKAQVVLQGKSREIIVRELQRTNLDVNLAVNNLLSREDDDGDDAEEGQDAYLPEELISLLDAGLQSGDHPSVILDADAFYSGDVFEYASAAARRRAVERGTIALRVLFINMAE